jgi:lysine 2,3-aminomutase
LPEYVLDLPGGHGKSPVGPSYVVNDSGSEIEDYRGRRHAYPPETP